MRDPKRIRMYNLYEEDLRYIICEKQKTALLIQPKHAINTLINLFKPYGSVKLADPEELENYYVAAFVRNPYSKVFSSFRHGNHMGWIKTNSFSQFVKDYLPRIEKNSHFHSAQIIIQKLPINTHLFRFEEFLSSLKIIFQEKMKIKLPEVPHLHPPTDNRNYRDQYSQLVKLKVAEIYKWDLSALNYEFDSYGELPDIKELKAPTQNRTEISRLQI